MDLLFKREQTASASGQIHFKLWGKLEVSDDEKALIERYAMGEAVLIAADNSEPMRRAARLGAFVFFVVAALGTYQFQNGALAALSGLAAGIGVGYWYLNEKRETIMVQDLLWGRHFKCGSVVDLARKEAWLESACGILRQVMESAKHWDGVERHTIEPLPKEQAKELILRVA